MADKETSFLKEWTVRYVKNKDIITKKIVSLEEFDDGLKVVRADKEQKIFIRPFLKEIDSEVKKYDKSKAVICFHTKDNYEFMMNNWKELVNLGRNFVIYFVNPFSKTERVLTLCPYTHEMISDSETLKQGLKTMSENVEFATEEEIKKIVNS